MKSAATCVAALRAESGATAGSRRMTTAAARRRRCWAYEANGDIFGDIFVNRGGERFPWNGERRMHGSGGLGWWCPTDHAHNAQTRRLGVCARGKSGWVRSLLPPPAPSVEAAAAEEQDNHEDNEDGCRVHGFLQKATSEKLSSSMWCGKTTSLASEST